MDRQIVYPGSVPLDTDLLNVQRSTMVAIGYLAQMMLGTGTVVDGLNCTPTAPPSLAVVIGPGSITQLNTVDPNAYGSLGPEANDPVVKMGVNVTGLQFPLQAPGTSGQSLIYLIQVSFAELDSGSLVLPYYNASNPSQPFSGANNTGVAQNTQRLQRVQVQVKAGAEAPTGTQVAPDADAGFVGIWTVTVNSGAQQVTAANIVQVPGAPFLPTKLPQLTAGYRNMAAYGAGSSGKWVAPNGVQAVKVRIWGGGGAGGAGNSGAGGGGAGGGFTEAYLEVVPGQLYAVTVANGGLGASATGGTSSFSNLASASGGGSGGAGASNGSGAGSSISGVGYGPGFGTAGSSGQSGSTVAAWVGGQGGAAFGNSGAAAVIGDVSSNLSGSAGAGPGAGGSGGIGTGGGGIGGAGLVVVEW